MSALKNGIYFQMPEDEYHAIDRLSKTGIKRLRVSPADFWHQSWLNPNPQELTPEQERTRYLARVIGRAYHCARLEPERFASIYVRKPSQADMPEGTLFTATDMKPHLKDRGLKISGTTEEQALALAADGFPRKQLWHLVMADWLEALPSDAVALDAKPFDEIVEDGRRLRAMPVVRDLLTGGCAEVTILYDCPDTGIPMKARLDYLRADRWIELKTFSNANGKHLYQCITDAIRFNRYHIDAASYHQAVELIRAGGLEIIGAHSVDDASLIAFIAARADPLECTFIFQQTGGVPNVLDRTFRLYQPRGTDEAIRELEESGASADHLELARHFREVSGSARHPTAIHAKARAEIRQAKEDFRAYSEIYNPGEPWLPFNPSGEITDDDFSPYWLEELA